MAMSVSTPTTPPEVLRGPDGLRVLNLSGYRFVALDDPEVLRHDLQQQAKAGGLRGTVLLATEGINFFVAGEPEPVRAWLRALRSDARFATIEVKESWSDVVPFRRLKAKVKREIIRMDHPTVNPASRRAPAVAPVVLKRWLDQGRDDDGRPVVLLDTRNEFEVQCGSFEGALDLRLARFTQFPDEVRKCADGFQGYRIVSFCTGGIRCEKAALYMDEVGIENVVQLDGGILRYFEEVGGDHFNGTCFVFDERMSLSGELMPAEIAT